jgi:hypothetical protein
MLALPAVVDELASAYTLIHQVQLAFAAALDQLPGLQRRSRTHPATPEEVATLPRGQFGRRLRSGSVGL